MASQILSLTPAQLPEITYALYLNYAEQTLVRVPGRDHIIWQDQFFKQGQYTQTLSCWLVTYMLAQSLTASEWICLPNLTHSLVFRYFSKLLHAGIAFPGWKYQEVSSLINQFCVQVLWSGSETSRLSITCPYLKY